MGERGVSFRSYRNGDRIDLTPESSVQAQKAFGADIIIPLDELPPLGVSRERLVRSVALSHRWEARSLREHLKSRKGQAMYGVVHGGTDLSLRSLSASALGELPFDGYAVGGSLGRDRAEAFEVVAHTLAALPRGKPNHLLGMADPESVERGAALGVDTCEISPRYVSEMYRRGA